MLVADDDDDDDDDSQLRGDDDKLDDGDGLALVRIGENDKDEHDDNDDDDDDDEQGGDGGARNNALPRLLIDDSVGTIVHRRLFDNVDVDEQRVISILYCERIVS